MNWKLIIILILLRSGICKADDMVWATDLGNNATEMAWKYLKQQFEEQERLELRSNLDSKFLKRPAGLYVFISTSMPKPLLKSYVEEVKQYSGILVFKGLPNGSFKELTRLVRELVGDQDNQFGLQIDDEAFERFGIKEVPTILLSQGEDYIPNQTAKVTFDKITGNVGIRYALEQFSASGELAREADTYLRGIK